MIHCPRSNRLGPTCALCFPGRINHKVNFTSLAIAYAIVPSQETKKVDSTGLRIRRDSYRCSLYINNHYIQHFKCVKLMGSLRASFPSELHLPCCTSGGGCTVGYVWEFRWRNFLVGRCQMVFLGMRQPRVWLLVSKTWILMRVFNHIARPWTGL